LTALLLAAAVAAPHAGVALVVSEPGPPPDAIVSLASHEWERLPATVAQAAAHPDALVVLTVPRIVTPYNCHDCGYRPEKLIEDGVYAPRIRQIALAESGTYGEALAMKSFMREYNLRHLLVVTSPYHTRRALYTFRSVFAGTPVTIGVIPATATSPARPQSWWAAPYDRAYVRYEWAAVLYYRLRYHVPLG
jgi:hypothetical protein